MAVSGLVTLVILMALGAAAYWTVATLTENDARTSLQEAVVRPVDLDSPYRFSGAGSGAVPITISSTGVPQVPRGFALPAGLPDAGSLAAITQRGDIDIRNVTLPDGTPCRVISGFNAAGLKVQWVENRTLELDLLNTLRNVLLGGGLLALLASLLAGYLYAGRALVPIRASIERRQSALQRQREFAANASHELRTPLTVIATSVEDLKRNRRSRVEDVGEAIGDIDAEVRHMTALVEDMLLLARTDSGVVQVDRVPLDLGDVAADAASMLTSVGQDRGVKVVLDPLPAAVSGDPLRLRQLVTILVDNAVRHSPLGSTVTVWVRPEPGGALLQVDDQGPGVKPDDLPRLFERFWRADDAPAGGTGLGLAIAKWIVDQHGGSIGAFNRPGSGASFWARLPDAPAGAAEGETASGPASEPGAADGSEQADWSAPATDIATPPSDRAEGPIAP